MTINILLVEDDPGDVALIEESFASLGTDVALQVVSGGDEALAFLRGQAPYAGLAQPDLTLLDLNLPRVGGLEVLEEIKADPALQGLAVVVFTSSSSARDVALSYRHGANCFITKPDDYSSYRGVIDSIERFWLQTATLPPRRAGAAFAAPGLA